MRVAVRSIRFRVALVAATAALSAVMAAAAVVWSLGRAEDQIAAALASQHRLDLWSAVSAQISDYTFVALDSAEGGPGARRLETARAAVGQAFAAIDAAVRASIDDAPNEAAKAASANRGRMLARLRAGFEVLDRQIGERIADPAGAAADQIRGALNGFAVTFAPNLSAIMDDERRTGQRILDDMRALRATLTWAAAAALVVALALAVWLFRSIARPLVSRLNEMGAMAAAIGRGELRTRLAVRGRDELSLAMAGFNRMAARLERREARLSADRDRLEQTVAERTADLRHANERLAAVDAARRRFFTDVSHELRTPLTVVLGECDLALRRLEREPGASAAEALATIHTRAQGLHRRVEDLLRIARSETGEVDLHLAATPVGTVVVAAVAGTAALARRAGVTVTSQVPAELAARLDPDWMRQVLEGLLANAVRHTPAGGTIRIGAEAAGDRVVLTVADSGTGIPAADLAHIFERFYRGGDAAAGSGFGIGLALAKWIVEKHKGSIAIDSATEAGGGRDRGTTVVVALPAADGETP